MLAKIKVVHRKSQSLIPLLRGLECGDTSPL
jgi:hypothetical protein